MGKTRGVHETTPELRNRMVGMYEAGLGLRDIAVAVNCSQRTVKRWLNRFHKEGTVETRERCGRKRATTCEEDDAIIRLATQTPLTAAKAVLPALGLNCSVDTIRERLHKAGIHNWSPSRKHMQRIPLGDGDHTTIQQAVWRPTGTQLGKKKLATKESNSKSKKQMREADTTSILTQCNNDTPVRGVELPDYRMYQQGADLNVSRAWPLDMVQGSHHYPQGQPHIQQAHVNQQQTDQQSHQQQLHPHQPHLEQLSRDQHPPDHQVRQQTRPKPNAVTKGDRLLRITHSDSCSNSSSSTDRQSDPDLLVNDDESKDDRDESQSSHTMAKKKGGKAKGTLETSVEIRNRMIGMSEAGLSTLSIALAINRSERTVKRWLERWNKEGNVQTKERKGRRRITTKEQDDAIIAMATQQPLTAAKHVAPALGLQCSVDTIRERLHKAGIHSWKLGKKQGEGNAVHTVHLWQPSGNRPNKPKLFSEKKKKASSEKKTVIPAGASQQKCKQKKKAAELEDPKVALSLPPIDPAPPACPFREDGSLASYVSGTDLLQPVHSLPVPPLVSSPSGSQISSSVAQTMQGMESMMQQRPDCRLANSVLPPEQAIPAVVYSSCMINDGNNHATHMDQPDPLNYEPYIWSF